MKIATTRLEKDLTLGKTVHRYKIDLSGVRVRTVTRGSDQTIDPVADSDQTLVINQEKGTAFPIYKWDEVQLSPLKPGQTAGKQVAMKVSRYVDATVLYEVVNADNDFDTGDLTTLASTGVPIVMSTTNVPIMVTRAAAKLDTLNVEEDNRAWVLDPYTIALIAQHAIGKELVMSENILKNGFSGNLFGWEVFKSNNLTGEAVLGMATNPTAADTVTINGVVFTFRATLSAAGDLHIADTVDETRANFAAALNAPDTAIVESGAGGYTPVSATNQNTLFDLRITATNNNSTNKLTIVAIGSGRLVLSDTLVDGTDEWDSNMIHAFAGRKGSIDVVIQDGIKPEMRAEPKQTTMNVLTNVLFGVKTFDDGAVRMLDVLIDATA